MSGKPQHCPHGVGASVCRHCEGLDTLRAEVERLTRELEEARGHADTMIVVLGEAERERDEARSNRDAAREALKAALFGEAAKAREAEFERLRAGIHLRGWWCHASIPAGTGGAMGPCGAFNGEEAGPRDGCRRCGSAKPAGEGKP